MESGGMQNETRPAISGVDSAGSDHRRDSSDALGAAMSVYIPGLRTKGGMNSREHHQVRARRVRMERQMVAAYVNGKPRPETPLLVTLTRIAPSNGLDDDNLASALKSVRDQVAGWMGVDDKLRDVVRYQYRQQKGPWAVLIEWHPMYSDS